MAPPGKSDIKVTASDALEFEPVAHEAPKRRWGVRTLVVLVLAAGGAAGWHYYGDRLRQLWGGAESGIPMIRAAATPVKVRPESPGGLEVPDRDKLVYDRLQGNADGRGPERLLPPPEQPLPRPAPAAAMPVPAPAATKPATAESPSPPLKPVAEVPTEKDVAAAVRPAPPPPPPAPPGASKPSPGLTTARRPPQIETPKAEAPKPAPAKVEPEKLSIPETPAAPKQAVAAAPPASPPAPAAAPAPSGPSYVVQLAAARSQEGAESEWEKLRSKNQDLLGSLRLTVIKADLGQARGVFYRLRAGPIADETSARELCSQLTKRQVGCLVIKPGQ